MHRSTVGRVVASTLTAALLLGSTAGATSVAPRAVSRPAAQGVHPNKATPGLEQVLIEGGAQDSLYLGNLADIVGVPIVYPNTSFYRDDATESSIPAKPVTEPQILYAAVGAGASQLDFVEQKSGVGGKTASVPPYVTDSFENYSEVAPLGFEPYAGTAAEPSGPAEDSIDAAAGDAPIPLGPAESAAYVPNGFTVYTDSLAAYNGNGDLTGAGFNTNRGPAIVAPILGTGTSIIFNTTNLTVPVGGLNLTQNDVCGIFTGVYTNWNQTSANPGNEPITLVHRSDGAAATFLLAYNLSQMCSAANPFHGTGAPVAANYWGQLNNTKTQGVGTDSNVFPSGGGFPQDASAPETIWPTLSPGANKVTGELSAVDATPGAVGYVGPESALGTSTAEANVENYEGNFYPANATTLAAALASTSTSSAAPPGYPSETKTTPVLYKPFPTAANGAALVGYGYAYVYTCYAPRLKDQVTGIKDFFGYAETKNATDAVVAAFWSLNALGTTEQKSLKTALGLIQEKAVVKAKTYYSPVNGAKLEYTCTDT